MRSFGETPGKREALLNKLVKISETPVKREETPEKGEEPVLQFTGKFKVIFLCAAAQESSVGYHKRISFPFLESSRTANGSWESFNFPQVSRMRLRKESKLCRPKETRLSTFTLLFSPSLSPLDFPYFQLFWMYPRQCRMVQAAECISSTSEAVYCRIHSVSSSY